MNFTNPALTISVFSQRLVKVRCALSLFAQRPALLSSASRVGGFFNVLFSMAQKLRETGASGMRIIAQNLHMKMQGANQ